MGWYESLNGRQSQAIKHWKEGLAAAQKFRMRYEQGLLHMRLGAVYVDDEILQKEHFNEAIRIFGEMDAVPMLRHTRELGDRK